MDANVLHVGGLAPATRLAPTRPHECSTRSSTFLELRVQYGASAWSRPPLRVCPFPESPGVHRRISPTTGSTGASRRSTRRRPSYRSSGHQSRRDRSSSLEHLGASVARVVGGAKTECAVSVPRHRTAWSRSTLGRRHRDAVSAAKCRWRFEREKGRLGGPYIAESGAPFLGNRGSQLLRPAFPGLRQLFLVLVGHSRTWRALRPSADDRAREPGTPRGAAVRSASSCSRCPGETARADLQLVVDVLGNEALVERLAGRAERIFEQDGRLGRPRRRDLDERVRAFLRDLQPTAISRNGR